GQYLAFIGAYTRLHGRPPSEAEIATYFMVSPPSAHQMVVTLERSGLHWREAQILLVDARQFSTRTGDWRQHQWARGEVQPARQAGHTEPRRFGCPRSFQCGLIDVESHEPHTLCHL
ncbi:MAG: hypothetical protein ACRDGS_02635, partial [Chloroflexota bacterium]